MLWLLVSKHLEGRLTFQAKLYNRLPAVPFSQLSGRANHENKLGETGASERSEKKTGERREETEVTALSSVTDAFEFPARVSRWTISREGLLAV